MVVKNFVLMFILHIQWINFKCICYVIIVLEPEKVNTKLLNKIQQ